MSPTQNRRHPSRKMVAGLLGLAVAALVVSWGPATDDDSKLYELMRGMKGNLKTIAGSLKEAGSEQQALEAVAEMEVRLLAAKAEDPANLYDKPRDSRTAHAISYQVDMAKTLMKVLELEVAILEGRREDAFAIATKELYKARLDGHDKYQQDG